METKVYVINIEHLNHVNEVKLEVKNKTYCDSMLMDHVALPSTLKDEKNHGKRFEGDVINA